MNIDSIISSIADKLGRKAHIFFVSLMSFMATVMLMFFVSAFTGKACGNSKIDASKRISYCNISIKSNSIFPSENRKRSIIYFERGILYSVAGENDNAVSDFITAINFASQTKKNDEAARRIARFMVAIETKKNEPNVEENWRLAISKLTAN